MESNPRWSIHDDDCIEQQNLNRIDDDLDVINASIVATNNDLPTNDDFIYDEESNDTLIHCDDSKTKSLLCDVNVNSD